MAQANGHDDGGHALANQYRNLLWALAITIVGALWGYAFFLHGQIAQLKEASDRREYYWDWASQENANRKGEFADNKRRISELERTVFTPEWWKYNEDKATKRVLEEQERNRRLRR